MKYKDRHNLSSLSVLCKESIKRCQLLMTIHHVGHSVITKYKFTTVICLHQRYL
jgi:hypothetical protein